jgi:rhodanese-related sulfurtransferase
MCEEARQQAESISVADLAALIENKDSILIVDIRTEAEYNAGHLRNSLWIPRGKIEFMASSKLPSRDDNIVVYCKRDGRSSLCALTLKQIGYKNAKYLTGGFAEWVDAGHSIFNIHGEASVIAFEKAENE